MPRESPRKKASTVASSPNRLVTVKDEMGMLDLSHFEFKEDQHVDALMIPMAKGQVCNLECHQDWTNYGVGLRWVHERIKKARVPTYMALPPGGGNRLLVQVMQGQRPPVFIQREGGGVGGFRAPPA